MSDEPTPISDIFDDLFDVDIDTSEVTVDLSEPDIIPDPAKRTAAQDKAVRKMKADTRKRADENNKAALKGVQPQARASGLEELEATRQQIGDMTLGDIARVAAADMMLRITGGEFPVKDAGQASTIARSMFEMFRLESGKATSLTGAEMSPEDREKRIREMTEQLQARAANRRLSVVPDSATGA